MTFAEQVEVKSDPKTLSIVADNERFHEFDLSMRKSTTKYATRRNFVKRVICLQHLRTALSEAFRRRGKYNDHGYSAGHTKNPMTPNRVATLLSSSQDAVEFNTSDGNDVITTPSPRSRKLQKRASNHSLQRNDIKNIENDNKDLTIQTEKATFQRRDELPDTRPELEIRLNYHLAELDRLKRLIRQMNDNIRDQNPRYQCFLTTHAREMDLSVIRLGELLQFSRDTRNSYGSFVAYHRREIERISEKRVALDIADGIEPRLPEIYSRLANDFEWMSLFLV